MSAKYEIVELRFGSEGATAKVLERGKMGISAIAHVVIKRGTPLFDKLEQTLAIFEPEIEKLIAGTQTQDLHATLRAAARASEDLAAAQQKLSMAEMDHARAEEAIKHAEAVRDRLIAEARHAEERRDLANEMANQSIQQHTTVLESVNQLSAHAEKLEAKVGELEGRLVVPAEPQAPVDQFRGEYGVDTLVRRRGNPQHAGRVVGIRRNERGLLHSVKFLTGHPDFGDFYGEELMGAEEWTPPVEEPEDPSTDEST